MKPTLISLLAMWAFSLFASAEVTDFISPFAVWEFKRKEFLRNLRPVKWCLTETKAAEIMRVINSYQCSSTPLPLDDAIHIEYDNWLSEDWFPDEDELEEMRLDDVM